jgi:Fe-S cluster assembly protein SufD
VTPFSPDAAANLDGPDWLRVQRVEAVERFAGSPLPSTDEEIWRYSRIASLDLDAFQPAAVQSVVVAGGGRVEPVTEPGLLGAAIEAAPDVFAELNTAFADQPLTVRVPRGEVVPEPVVIEHRVSTAGAAVFPRLVVEAGEASEITVVERFVSADVHALVVPVVELIARPGAHLRYLAVNELGRQVWLIGHQVARGERDSRSVLATVALGGDYARVRTDARLVGPGAEGEQVAAYFGEGDQMHDFRTLQDHAAPKTRSNLLFKGAVQGRSQSVYTGLIRVRKEARGTDAFQTNRNLKLSEHAWAESVPNLDIETNDVRCSHASAVGPIDEDQRFYLESRGVPPDLAERLIVLGFFADVFERLPVPSLVPELEAEVAAKLDRREREEGR